MFRTFDNRAGHYLLIAAIWALTCLPNLGGPVLWDMDEGLSAEAAREMLASGNLVVPTFNYQLRTAKPALLYWLQAASYRLLGVNETAARLPSALAALLALLATCELGRSLFGRTTGLLAGVLLATSIGVLGAAHFANPDALLLAFTTLTLMLWHRYYLTGRSPWLHAAGAACGLAVLAKGPVGLVVPGAVVFCFLLWQRQLRRLVSLHMAEAVGFFVLVAAPWYVWVGVETKGVFLKAFLYTEHLNKASTVMEAHGGTPLYYVGALLVGLVPWSLLLIPAAVGAWKEVRLARSERDAARFLIVWVGVYFVVFSIARTKLPNYILPMYPAVVLLMAWALDRWRSGEDTVPGWVLHLGLVCLALLGTAATAGLLVGGGVGEWLPEGYRFPGLTAWAWVGLVPLVGAVVGWRMLAAGRRDGLVATLAVAAVAFLAPVTGGVLEALNCLKSTRALAEALPPDHLFHEVRLGAYDYDRPSLVFYCRREVRQINGDRPAVRLLAEALPAYLFVPEERWLGLKNRAPVGVEVLARCPDLYRKSGFILLVANGPAVSASRSRRLSESLAQGVK